MQWCLQQQQLHRLPAEDQKVVSTKSLRGKLWFFDDDEEETHTHLPFAKWSALNILGKGQNDQLKSYIYLIFIRARQQPKNLVSQPAFRKEVQFYLERVFFVVVAVGCSNQQSHCLTIALYSTIINMYTIVY